MGKLALTQNSMTQAKVALITGITGQDGAYLAEFLLAKGELAAAIRDAVGAQAEIQYDRSKPDGTPQKLLDISLLRSLGWQPRIALAEGLRATYAEFQRTLPAT